MLFNIFRWIKGFFRSYKVREKELEQAEAELDIKYRILIRNIEAYDGSSENQIKMPK